MSLTIQTLFVLLIFCTVQHIQAEDLTKMTTKELIERLASPNPSPKQREDGRNFWVEYPPGYQPEKQREILPVMVELQRREVNAFPELIDAIDDERFSLVRKGNGKDVYHQMSVGRVCGWLLHIQIDAAAMIAPYPTRYSLILDKDEWKTWYAKRQKASLIDLQQESCRFFIARQNSQSAFDQNDNRYYQDCIQNLQRYQTPLRASISELEKTDDDLVLSIFAEKLTQQQQKQEVRIKYSDR